MRDIFSAVVLETLLLDLDYDMKSRTQVILAAVIMALAATTAAADSPTARWPAENAWQWHSTQPRPVGCNFLPSTAVNDVGGARGVPR